MVTSNSISAGTASSYYDSDDYYSKESEGLFCGNLKEEYNINDKFDTEKFHDLVNQNELSRDFEIKFNIDNSKLTNLNDNEIENLIDNSIKSFKDNINENKDINVVFKKDHLVNISKNNIEVKIYSHRCNISTSKDPKNTDTILNKLKNYNAENKLRLGINYRLKEHNLSLNKDDVNSKIKQNRGKIGDDITFSMPKSCSIESMLSDDKFNIITDSHNNAVNKSIEYIENNYCYYKQQIKGENYILKDNKILGAKFNHVTSRELDPQIHTHFVIFKNLKDHRFHNQIMYKNKKLINNIYMNELSKNLQKSGYEIVFDDKSSKFEIKGYDRSQIEYFSKRTTEINKIYKEMGIDPKNTSYNEINIASLKSRKTKNKNIDVDKWKTYVRSEIEKCHIKGGIKKEFANTNFDKNQYMNNILKEIEKMNSAFTKEDFLNYVLINSNGRISIQEANGFMEDNLNIVKVGSIKDGSIINEYYSTINNIKLEKNIYDIVKNAKENGAFIDKKSVDIFLKDTSLNVGQENAVRLIATSKSRVIAVQGDAGTGKTFMLNEARRILEKENFTVIGLAPSNKAVVELKNGAGINNASTIHSYLNKLERDSGIKPEINSNEIKNSWNFNNVSKAPGKEIIIVDESSMIDNKVMSSLHEAAEKRGSKIVMIGDTKQLQPVGQGKAFTNIINNNMCKYAHLDESMRQKEFWKVYNSENLKPDDIKLIHNEAKNNNALVTFYKGNANNVNITDKDNYKDFNLNIGTKNYKIFKDDTIKQSVKDTANNNIKDSINRLDKRTIEINNRDDRLFKISKDFTNLNTSDRNNSIIVTATNRDKDYINNSVRNMLKEKGDIGKSIKINNKEFSVGEKIIFNKTDKLYGVKIAKNDVGIIKDIKNNTIYAKLDKRDIKFSINNYNKIDYGYAKTTYKSQGETAKNVFVNIDTKQYNMNNRNDFYVKISRAKEDITIYTDDKSKLLNNVNNKQLKVSIEDINKISSKNNVEILKDINKKINNYVNNSIKDTSNIKDFNSIKNFKISPDELSKNNIKLFLNSDKLIMKAKSLNLNNVEISKDINKLNKNNSNTSIKLKNLRNKFNTNREKMLTLGNKAKSNYNTVLKNLFTKVNTQKSYKTYNKLKNYSKNAKTGNKIARNAVKTAFIAKSAVSLAAYGHPASAILKTAKFGIKAVAKIVRKGIDISRSR